MTDQPQSQTPVAVDTAPAESAHNYLLCMDAKDTEASRRALEYTRARLAHAGDLVVLFTVVEHPMSFAPAFSSIYSSGVDKEALKKEEALIQASVLSKLEDASKGFVDGVKVEQEVQFGSVGATVEKIVDACQKHGCEIIITGRRKRTATQRWLGSGSVSTALLTNTDFSVLIVR